MDLGSVESWLYGGNSDVVSTSVKRHEVLGPIMSTVFMTLRSSEPAGYRTQGRGRRKARRTRER